MILRSGVKVRGHGARVRPGMRYRGVVSFHAFVFIRGVHESVGSQESGSRGFMNTTDRPRRALTRAFLFINSTILGRAP